MRDIAKLDEETSEPEKLHTLTETQLREFIGEQEHRVERLKESIMGEVTLAIDNLGWAPLSGGDRNDTGLRLESVKQSSDLNQALITVNPLVKRGVAVRISYIWGSGVELGASETRQANRSLRRSMASVQAQFELERSLAADGNLFVEVTTSGTQRRVRVVPLDQVGGAAGNPDDNSVIEYILLRYNRFTTPTMGTPGDPRSGNGTSGQARVVEEWVPTVELEGTPVSAIDGIEVNRGKRIKHIAVNRLKNWWWGVPDLYPVAYWVKAYKKYLEQCAVLNEAYAQFAYKASTNTRAGGERMHSQIAADPGIDPATGQPLNIGATAILGANQDLTALQHGRPVDFTNGLPLAAMVAAGLEIPLQVLTSDASTGGSRASDDSLDEATKKAMEARQQFLSDELRDVAEMLGVAPFEIEWPRVGEEPLHRVVQALDVAGRSGMLYPTEWRNEILRALSRDVADAEEEPPTEKQLPLVIQPGEEPQAAGDQDAPALIEPPSEGDHSLRDEGDQQHTEET